MANRSILTMSAGQVQNQSSSDNIVLNAPLDLAGFTIYSGVGDIIMVPTQNDCIVGGTGHTTNNAALGFIGGGANGILQTSNHGFIGAGIDCRVTADDAVVLGGNNNDALSACSVVCGGQDNTANGTYATVLGGKGNVASGNVSTVGGEDCTANGEHATSLGGKANIAGGGYATCAGGQDNTVLGSWSIASGYSNTVSGNYSAVLSGNTSVVSGKSSAICGGQTNNVSGNYSTIGGGVSNNIAGEYGFIGGGEGNKIASGADYSTVPGGYYNLVEADYATALGRYAVASHLGCVAQSGGKITSNGDTQCIRAITYGQSATNNTITLYLDGSSASLQQPADTVWLSKIWLAGLKTDGTAGASYQFLVTTRRDGTANCVLTGNSSLTNPYIVVMTEDNSAWNIGFSIVAPNNLTVLVVGATGAGTVYNWVASWEITQVGVF